jgi:hypothetical protein
MEGQTIKTLAGKMAAILGEVSRIPKSGRNKFQNYDYATEGDALDAIRPLLSKHNIAVFFDCVEVNDLENGRTRVRVQIELVCGDSGESRSSFAFGEARDVDSKGNTMDKGIYKAITGAMKYWMFKTFMISTGDDPEADGEPGKAAANGSKPTPAGKAVAGARSQVAPVVAKLPGAPSPSDLALESAKYAKANGLTSEDIQQVCAANNLPNKPADFKTDAQAQTFAAELEDAIAAKLEKVA